MYKNFVKIFILFCFFTNIVKAETVKNIDIKGNLRVNSETIKMFSGVTIGEDLSSNDLNTILKNLYETNFFKDVQVNFNQSKLEIIVIENPIIQSIEIKGVKNKSLEKALLEKINLKKGSSFSKFKATSESKKIQNILRTSGFYLSSIETLIGNTDTYQHNLIKELLEKNKSIATKIKILGQLDFNMVKDYLNNSSLFLFASTCENLPFIVLEAISYGLPVITTDKSPMNQIVAGQNIFF